MQIFNGWGQVIFETTLADGRGWDGHFNNKEQPQGVFIYEIKLELDNRISERYRGNATLVH